MKLSTESSLALPPFAIFTINTKKRKRGRLGNETVSTLKAVFVYGSIVAR